MTRSKLEDVFHAEFPHLNYEEHHLPYITNYMPDFSDMHTIVETKGLLERQDAKKITSAHHFLTTDKLYVIAGAHFEHYEKVQKMLEEYNVTMFKYPEKRYILSPSLSPREMASFRLNGVPRGYTNFPLSGLCITAWAAKNRIPCAPITYSDFNEVKPWL